MKEFFKKNILITGGTGTFGKAFIYYLNNLKFKPSKICIYARDEHKFHDLENSSLFKKNIRLFIGDVRDQKRLDLATSGMDIVVHAAALKHVPFAEYNPMETISTNILGSNNLINACIKNKVKKCMLVSTDKAVNPINLYGSTKLCAEKIFIASNNITAGKTKFSVVRYGNVLGSRGSLIEKLKSSKEKNVKSFNLTHEEMTRFWITIEEAVNFVGQSIKNMDGGEIFIPKMKSMKIINCIKVFLPEAIIKNVGIRPGEKIHETLIHQETKNVFDCGKYYIILPEFKFWTQKKYKLHGKKTKEKFEYSSDKNKFWIKDNQLERTVL
jgi:UDP-N-acetylglucosamine 4,6-dehydratase